MDWLKYWFTSIFVRKPIIKRIETLEGEAQFLAGRHSRFYEFFRVWRIAYEFIRGFQTYHFIGPTVTFFGSARLKEGTRYYGMARSLAALLAKDGWTIMTGGGPGIMEAANRGAKDVHGHSVGANIILPFEQKHNGFLDKVLTFSYFFVRKVMLVKYSFAYIVFPGGFGTLDETMEALTLIQTGKLYDFPVILVGKDYWQGLMTWLEEVMIPHGTIHQEDLKMLTLTDDLNEIAGLMIKHAERIGLDLK